MNLSRLVLVTSLGLGLFSTGCLGAQDSRPDDDIDVPDVEPPRFKPLESNSGGIGPNGLKSPYFHANKIRLLHATDVPLLGPDSKVSAGVLATGLLDTPEGLMTLKYAVKCAVPEGVNVAFNAGPDTEGFSGPYTGGAILGTTAGWTTAALDVPAKEDLFACMLAHLNPSGAHVDIQLTGQSVPVDFGTLVEQSAYTFTEALWAVEVTSFFTLNLYVWPLGDLKNACGRGVIGSLQTRICGEGDPDCGLQVRFGIATDCNQIATSGDYTCLGHRAIKTRLQPKDVSKLNGGCGL